MDASDGSVVERVVYDPYGQPTFYDASWENPSASSAYANEVLFTGHRRDPETGLYVTLYRIYHPTLGRWLQRDPIGYADGMGLYEYTRSSPTYYVDPLGLWGRDFHQYKTTMLAVMAGMCFPGDVGAWANAPDEDWRSAPRSGIARVPLYGGGIAGNILGESLVNRAAEWHFPKEPGKDQVEPGSNYARGKYQDGIDRCNLKMFAEGLHTFQDSWAHQGKPPIFGIGHSRKRESTEEPAWRSHDADNVEFWPEDAWAAAEETFDAMIDFMKACPCILEGPHEGEKSECGPSVGDISPILDKWFPEKNKPSVGGYQPPPPPASGPSGLPREPRTPTLDTLRPGPEPQMAAW